MPRPAAASRVALSAWTARTLIAVLTLAVLLGGCGFLASGRRPSTKPDLFILRGYVSVGPLPAGVNGTACQAPPAASDIHAGGPVRVADTDGRTLGAGQLSGGVLAVAGDAARCNFAFEVPGVPGGVDRYVIGVGSRPTLSFPARELREDKPAVISINV